MAPRWTYTEANASRWRHLFDDLIGGTPALDVPLEGNGKSLCSLLASQTPSNGLLTSSLAGTPHPWSLTPA